MGADVGFDAIHAKTQQHHKVVKGGPVTAESIANTTEGLIIIGAGPAGLSAAIYGSRANLRPLVISHDAGQLSKTGTVENFPSCTWNASGSDIMTSFREQADQFGARFLSARVQSVDLRSLPYRLTLGSGVSLNFKALIVASGAASKWLHVPGESKYFNKGVASCATCDGWFFRNKRTVVIGGGDTAMETALFLARICTKVTIIHRRGKGTFRASKIMGDRAMMHPKISVVWNAVVKEFGGDGAKLTHVTLNIKKGDQLEELQIPTDGAFVSIGHQPNTQMLFGDKAPKLRCGPGGQNQCPQIDTDAEGYLKTKAGTHTETSVEGVFAAGDVADRVYRQAITSAGTGAMAAMDAERYLCQVGC